MGAALRKEVHSNSITQRGVRVLGSEGSQFLKCWSFARGVTESCTTWIGTYFILYNIFSLGLFKMDVISLV